jgi:hypothetical protein
MTEPPSVEQPLHLKSWACRELIAEGEHDGYRGL